MSVPTRKTLRNSLTQHLRTRRGVASVLAMMFMVLFGSLAVAMAVASQGNLRTAQTHLHVMKAMGAAETGLTIAQKHLTDSVARFVIAKGTVDSGFGWRLWTGNTNAGDGTVNVLAAANGCHDTTQTRGVADAILNSHLIDVNIIHASGYPSSASIFTPSGDTDTTVYKSDSWVRTPLIAIDANASQTGVRAAGYQITYAPLANGTDVRVIVTGYSSIGASGSDYQYLSSSASTTARPVTRVIEQDFRIVKRPAQAMLSPSRIMIGKNVMVTGDLGARYTDVAQQNGHPIEIKSDFYGLDPSLDAKLARFFQALTQYDVDGDNRLRVGHPIESQGLPGAAELQAHGWSADAFSDVTHDGYVDEFDIFVNHFDSNHDGALTLSAALTAGTPAAGHTPEFTLDDDLALLIDSANPDRNKNGVSGYVDTNHNGRWDPGEPINDFDATNGTYPDRVLGWRDGVIDRKDQYAKVRGRLVLKVNADTWALAQGGSIQPYVRGPIVPPAGESAAQFNVGDDVLPPLDASSFTNDQTGLKAIADGSSFDQQVATNLGISSGSLATYTEAGAANSTAPKYWRADLDDAYVFSHSGKHIYEKMPYNSPAYADWYYRPRYENMQFKNVQIPQGNNGLFINCTFAGVTYVRTYIDNTHVNWSLYGGLQWSSGQNKPVATTAPLDKSDFLRYTTGNVVDGPANYAAFPDPPVINGQIKTGAARDTKQFSNNLRFHDSLFVGSIVSDTPTAYTHVRNKMQFTGATRFSTQNPDQPNNTAVNPNPEDVPEISKSSMMLPNYSVDVGQFNSPTDTYAGGPPGQHVALQGTIVAGVLDIRGTANIDGALFMTFAPIAGQGPLTSFGQAVGNPANFNCTLGYFGPQDGDGEAIDPSTLPIVNGHKIVGWDLDGDGIPDMPPDQTPTAAQIAAGAVSVPFYGYGRIALNWNPNLPMPDGIMLPATAIPLTLTYREGK